ncbi:PREDICTED: coiled-coil domain-containing protein 81 isoform X2 [Elephantulus edwardii]|uniref:coiled-coil domain-containing protein 81 isoform X2 n=1 Tax=Elephantulus edwardii TaxID=28737 RepID=UPI0003F08032|nr:PREDICTED: coiled-coil domain-containing protein 81 isoform X2 [Elephantulus edwardii]
MLDTLTSNLEGLGKRVLPTLPSLSQEEVSTIWENVSEFVQRHLTMNKGVQIPGLGIFTFTRQKLEVGNKCVLLQRPVFILAEKLVQLHGLKKNKRPGTVDSVLSSREDLGKRPSSVLAFPRIDLKKTESKQPMKTIVEESEGNREREVKMKDQLSREGNIRETQSPKRLRDRQCISPAKVTNVDLLDELEQNESGGRNTTHERVTSPSFLKFDNEMKPKSSPVPACKDHNRAGQEMCYVCLQRMQRNSSSYYGEEWKKREREDERLLQQYQLMKEQEAICRQQIENTAAREQNQKNAAYNLGVAEAIRNHKNEKPEFYKSYIFYNRPLSSEIKAGKQEEYSQSLLKQINNQREKETKQRQNEDLMDHLEQVQLTEELAAQRAKYLKDKMEESQCYKRALDAQIKKKSQLLPAFEPDSSEPLFGKEDGEVMMGKFDQEQNCMKHQLEAAASRKRRDILNHLVDQRQDLQMLERTRKKYLEDKTAELERVNKLKQCLKKDWERSAEIKRQRDLEEKAFERASNKLFLLDQCESHKRCKQCQRRVSNVGQSNLWPLNKHLYGSWLLV